MRQAPHFARLVVSRKINSSLNAHERTTRKSTQINDTDCTNPPWGGKKKQVITFTATWFPKNDRKRSLLLAELKEEGGDERERAGGEKEKTKSVTRKNDIHRTEELIEPREQGWTIKSGSITNETFTIEIYGGCG